MPFPTLTVRDSSDVVRTINTQPSSGRVVAADSHPVVLSNEDKAVLDTVATAANQSAQTTLFGAVTETAPASDTASSGLNGRLQRVAQRISSLIALLPTALGAGGGLRVDGSGTALPVSGTVAVSNPSSVGGTLVVAGVSLPVKQAFINASASGDTSIVALVAGKAIRVLSYELTANGAVNVHFRSNSTVISSTKYSNQAGWGLVRSYNPHGYFETTAGQALQINLSGAVAVGVQVTYVEV